MKLTSFLKTIAYIDKIEINNETFEIWKSKHDHSYLGHVCLEEDLKFLMDNQITDQVSFGLGFSPKSNKWFGWTHRGVYGFGIGSTCDKGDIHYKPSSLEDLIISTKEFWMDEYRENVKVEKIKDGMLKVSWRYLDTISNPNLRGKEGGLEQEYTSSTFGKGKWVANSLDDAKQMAIDLRSNLS